MSQPNRPKPNLLQTPRRVVLTAAALAVLTAATIIGAGCMTPAASTKPAATVSTAPASTPAAQAASAPEAKPAPASAAPNTGQATLTQAQGEGRSRFVLVRWQEPNEAPKELPSNETEGEGADPAAQPIAIEFSAGLEAANGVASGYAGCNRFSGPYEKLASGMRFGNLVTTRMACDPARMELETAFLEALKSPLATVGMQPSAAGAQGRQVIWKTASGALLQFAERPLSTSAPRGQNH